MLLHQGAQGVQQRFAPGHLQLHAHRVKFIVVVVFFPVVVGAALVNHVFHRSVQPQQHIRVDAAVLHMHQLHAGHAFFADGGFDTGQRGRIQAVGLVHHHQVGGGQLVGKQLVQR